MSRILRTCPKANKNDTVTLGEQFSLFIDDAFLRAYGWTTRALYYELIIARVSFFSIIRFLYYARISFVLLHNFEGIYESCECLVTDLYFLAQCT